MDKLKTRVLFISLIILALVSIGAVAAADSVNDDIISANQEDFDLSEETNDVEQLGANAIDDTDSNDPLTAGEPGSFSELQDLIDATPEGEILELDSNYIMGSEDKPLIINKTITIDGKGNTLDANHLNATLYAVSQVNLKNIVFINGNCSEFTLPGALYVRGTVNLIKGSDESTIDNCIFKDNAALMGGGIYWTSNYGTITNSRFENNVAMRSESAAPSSSTTAQGGAIYWKGANGKIDNCNFTENSAPYSGGAIYYQSANNQSIENSYFYKNGDNNYGSNSGGGAIYFAASSNVTIVNTNFTENSVNGSGGAVYIDKNSKNHSIKDSSFTNNSAIGLSGKGNAPSHGYGGGAVFWLGSDGSIENSNFTDNTANIGGAVYYKESNTHSINGSNFFNNTATMNAISTTQAATPGGGAIYFQTTHNVNIEDSNFTENSAFAGGAVYFNKGTNVSIADSSFLKNSANDTTLSSPDGGAIFLNTVNNATIENVNCTENYAKHYGGAIYDFKGTNTQLITDALFTENIANSGGAIYIDTTNDVNVENTNFVNNSALTSNGGAISWKGNEGSVKNVNFTGNYASSSGGAIYFTSANNQSIADSSFSNNTANSSGGAIYFTSSKDGSIKNVNFTENVASTNGGAIVYYSTGNNNQSISDSSFSNNIANGSTSQGGAIYWASPNGTIVNSNFTENSATRSGGAIYFNKATNQAIIDSSFSSNTAKGTSNSYGGGAIYISGTNNASFDKVNFTDNLANYGGAIYTTTTNETISGSTFNGNNATSGSAIYHNSGSLNISSTELLENQAKAASLTASAKVEGFDATISTVFKGNDNLLNSIYTKVHTNVRLTDVSYWGAEDKMNTGASEVTPVASADDSNDGELVYIDDREAGINITVSIYDADGNFIKNITGKTDIYGDINISNLGLTPGKYKAKAIHEEDNYYTEIVSKEFKFEILKANSTVNGTDETEVYKNPVVVTVASENATAVIYNITDSEGTVVVVPDTSVDANGTFTVPVNLDVGEYTVNYKTVVDEEYYNINTNSSKITITPAPSSVNAEDVEKVYGEEITVTVASENATQVTYNITNSEGTVVVANTTVDANGEFTVPVALDVGEYTVTLTTIVDGNHMTNTNTSKITITPAPSSVNAEDVEKVYGEEITVTVASENATQVTYNITNSEGTVVVANTTVDANGEFTVPVALDVGEYTVTLTTIVDGNHISNTSTSKITITPAASSISAEDVEKVYSDDVVLIASGDNSTGINESTVVVRDAEGNIVDATVTVSDDFTITIIGLDAGEYKVSYTNTVDKNHITSSNVTNVVVLKIDTAVSNESASDKPGKKVTVDFTVDDQKGNPVHNGNLTVTVDGKEYVVNVTDGKATFKDIILPDTPGKYNYEVSYSGEDNYNPSVGQLNLTVQKVDVIVTLPEVINYTGAVVDIVVDVIDEYGNPVNEGTVNLVIDFGTKLSNKLMATALSNTAEVSNGKAVFKDITLGEPGKYPSYAQYSGSDYYNEAENTSDVIVLPLNTTTESQDVSGHSGDKKDITADIVDQNGNPVKNGTAVLKVNGKEYTAEVKDGKAIFKDVELPSESTDATIDYLGNEYYNPSSTTIKITISEDEEPEGGDEPINGTEDKTSTANAVKAVSVLPSTGNPIALVILALLTLVSTVSLGNKK